MGNNREQKEDKSVRVPQKSKLKQELSIRSFPWTEKQKELIRIIQSKENNIILLKGAAGSSKTLIAVYTALAALAEKKIGEIVYVRSVVESASHSMGFLPGTQNDKLSPYLQPLIDKLGELLPESQVKGLIMDERVRGIPVGFLRGLSLNACYLIGDECQNLTVKEILTLSTRLGKFSKLILVGDIRQSDIKDGGFSKVFDLFDDEESKKHGIVTFSFGIEDIMRSEVVKFIVQKFEELDKK